MVITVLSESIKRRYVTHSVCTWAFFYCLIFWVIVLVVPVCVTSFTEIQLPNNVSTKSSRDISKTGNFLVYANSTLFSALNPFWTVGTAFANSQLVVNITSTGISAPYTLFGIIELEIDSLKYAISMEMDVPSGLTACSGWYGLENSFERPSIKTFGNYFGNWTSTTLTKKEAKLSLFSSSNVLQLRELLSPACDADTGSLEGATFLAFINVGERLVVEDPSFADYAKINCMYFVVLLIVAEFCVSTVYSRIVKNRRVYVKRIDPIEMYAKWKR